jgi:Helix-turn-helix domain
MDFAAAFAGTFQEQAERRALVSALPEPSERIVLRKATAISQAEIAVHLGVTPPAYGLYERGESLPRDLSVLRRLLSFYLFCRGDRDEELAPGEIFSLSLNGDDRPEAVA